MKIKITELKNNPANPRNITEKEFSKLITSLLVFPEMLSTRPMIINASHEVLGGNQRLRALLAISQMEEAEISQRITNSSDGKPWSDSGVDTDNHISWRRVWQHY